MLKHLFILLALLVLVPAALATTFVVPTDEEMVARADAIVIARVERQWVEESRDTVTVYEVRIERTIKGSPHSDDLVRVVSPGGFLKDHGVYVPGAARFADGERALLFLTLDHGRWMTTDLTLGKFRFTTTTDGERVLVRNLDGAGAWDRSGAPHRERVRREAGFLRFLEGRAAGRRPAADYFATASALTVNSAMEESAVGLEPHAPAFPAATYTDNIFLTIDTPDDPPFSGYVGIRWENMAAGVTFYKRTDQNIPGAGDGGVSVIQNGLAAWNNEPASNINLIYGGPRATASANHDDISVVEFNDPQNRIGGSFGGVGTVGTTFLSFFDPHQFPAGTWWWSIQDADVVFQDGYTAASVSFPTAMTHEVGHGIGWRHSDAHYIRPTGFDEPCQPAVEECSGTAIMFHQSDGSLGYTLQTWDQNASQAVYPGGGPTCTPASITSQPTSRTITSGAGTTLTVIVGGTAPITYQWYLGTSGNISQPISGATLSSLSVGPTTTTNYWVRVSNACGSADSVTATVTVTGGNTNPGFYLITPCRLADTRNPNAPYGGPALNSNTVRNFVVAGQCGIPSGITAVALNVAAVTPPSQGRLTLFPGPISNPVPTISNINFRIGETISNNAIVPVGADGSINVFSTATSPMHAVIDIFGFFR